MIEKMEEYKNIFLEYANNYEHSGRVDLKINHTLRVADNCYEIAKSLNLRDEDILLSYLIGICHDIGRFEQLKRYNSFNDSYCCINHAEFSNQVLFDKNLIKKFSVNSSLYSIIKKAIYYHNRIDISNDLSEREKLFSNIIRDADKIDILYALTTTSLENLFWYDDFDISNISEEVINDFYQEDLIPYKDVKNNADQIVVFYAYIYDFNFKKSYLKILEKNYYNIFLDRICNKFSSIKVIRKVKKINDYTKSYIVNQLNK